MTTDIVIVPRTVTLEFTDEQRQMIRDTYANGANDKEFSVLLEIAKKRRLDPMLRQIHFVQRWNADLKRMVWAPQVSIDGLRAIAQRTGLYDGQDEPEFEERAGELYLAKVRVYRKDWARAAVGVAYWSEYVQTTKDGNMTRMWRQMPHVMLSKVAESIALRKAFPEDCGGLYTDEEMSQADSGRDEQPAPTRARPRAEAPAAPQLAAPSVLPSIASMGVEAPAVARPQVVAVAPAPVVEPVAEPSEALVAFRSQLARVDTPASAVTLWLAARGDLVGDEAGVAWREIGHRILAVWPNDHTPPKSAGGWLKLECAKADAAPSPTPPEEPPPSAPKRTRKTAPAADATSSPASSGAPSDGPAALAAVPAWMGSTDAMRDHLASKTHVRAVEASVRQHGRHSRAYLDLAARRVEALTPADADGARITLASCALAVERWAHEGPRQVRRAA
jgi:phage recombination protein Bet